MSKKYLVIDVGGTFIKYAVIDDNGNFISKDKCPTPMKGQDDFLNLLEDLYHQQEEKISGIAISAAGMVDADRGIMINGGAVRFIRNLPIAKIMSERCGVPVTVENDAKCAALAEVWKGALKECRNGIALIIGTAIGGAVIIDRKVLRGEGLLAGEFSYMFLDAFDVADRSKALGGWGVPRLIKNVEKRLGRSGGTMPGEEIFKLADEGDNEVISEIRKYANVLAVIISNLQVIIAPERFVIGGGISRQPLLIQMIQEELDNNSQYYFNPIKKPDVVNCEFYNDSNMIGALYAHLFAS